MQHRFIWEGLGQFLQIAKSALNLQTGAMQENLWIARLLLKILKGLTWNLALVGTLERERLGQVVRNLTQTVELFDQHALEQFQHAVQSTDL